MQFNSQTTIATQTNKRHGSADRIQRKLHSVERSNSASGRLVPGNISIIRIEGFYLFYAGSTVNEQIGQELNNDK